MKSTNTINQVLLLNIVVHSMNDGRAKSVFLSYFVGITKKPSTIATNTIYPKNVFILHILMYNVLIIFRFKDIFSISRVLTAITMI